VPFLVAGTFNTYPDRVKYIQRRIWALFGFKRCSHSSPETQLIYITCEETTKELFSLPEKAQRVPMFSSIPKIKSSHTLLHCHCASGTEIRRHQDRVRSGKKYRISKKFMNLGHTKALRFPFCLAIFFLEILQSPHRPPPTAEEGGVRWRVPRTPSRTDRVESCHPDHSRRPMFEKVALPSPWVPSTPPPLHRA